MELGLLDHVQKDSSGRYSIRLPVYLPEAIITQPNSRSNSPAPQLPTFTTDFEIIGPTQRANTDRKKGIRIFLGSDTLRAHSADILFSQNRMTIYGDDRNKLSVPFVRPEDENFFKNLCTFNVVTEKNELKATAAPFTPTESKPKVEATPDAVNAALAANAARHDQPKTADQLPSEPQSPFTSTRTSDMNSLNQALEAKAGDISNALDLEKHHIVDCNTSGPEISDAASASDSTRRESVGGIWGSWRQGTSTGSETGRDSESSSGYQRPTRGGRNMKVLKPSKSISSTTAPLRSSSAARTGAAYEPSPSRSSGEIRRKSQAGGNENVPLRWEPKRMNSGSEEPKAPKTITTVPRSSNPVGGASAFAWMNSS
jgi:hypothetical protein